MENTLEEKLSAAQIAYKDDAQSLDKFSSDWSKLTSQNPRLVVFPETTEEVSVLAKICSALSVPMVPVGGLTGLAGAANAQENAVSVSFERLNQVIEFDAVGKSLHCGAGVVTEELLRLCESKGYRFPIDLAAKGSSQNGGNVATNAGGLEVVHYGMTRRNILGLKVVLASGEVLDLTRKLEKHNVGYDLKHLFIGSEGTLGMITEVVWRIHPKAKSSRHVMLPLQKPEDISEILKQIHRSAINVQRFELVDISSIRLVESLHEGVRCPLELEEDVFGCLLLEFFDESADRIEEWLGSLFDKDLIADAVVPKSSNEVENIWQVRELVSESLSFGKHLWKEDLSVPLSRLSQFVGWLDSDLRAKISSGKLYLFGHVGDGNVHVNICSLEKDEGFEKQKSNLRKELMDFVQSLRGSHSAEHGVGLLKRDLFANYLSDVERSVMFGIKRSMDPQNLLNPGKLFDVFDASEEARSL